MKATPTSAAANPGILYLCATPIGNLKDASFRLVETLASVDYIAAEDTRVTQNLLARYQITTRTISLQKFNESARTRRILADLGQGKSVALVSDAGMPTLSDPGGHLVQHAHAAGIKIEVIPGPSAITSLAALSGMAGHGFIFAGFFPRPKDRDVPTLSSMLGQGMPVLFFESPNRILNTLNWLADHICVTQIAVAKELTKTFEWTAIGTLPEVLEKLATVSIKGEWSFIVSAQTCAPRSDDPEKWVADLKAQGLSFADVLAVGKQFFDVPRNVLYRIYHL